MIQRLSGRNKQLWWTLWTDKIIQQSSDAIKALEEILGSLRITKDNISNRSTEPAIPKTEVMSIAPAVYNENIQVVILKSIVPDSE